MKAEELVLMWNRCKGVRQSVKGADGQPTTIIKRLENMIANYGEDVVTAYIKAKLGEDESYINKFVGLFNPDFDAFKKEFEKPAVEPSMGGGEVNFLQALAKEVVRATGKDLFEQIKEKVDKYVGDKTLIKAVSIDNMPAQKLDEKTHEKFESVLKFVAADEPVMLAGPAGSGKNVIVKQVAKALGLKFYFSNAVTQEYKLTGFVDAMGKYHGTEFYHAFTEGGIFMLDEMDASIPEVLVILNAAIANRYFDFPQIGRVDAHKDFRVIACANTFGTGATVEYSGRYQLDAASLNRFGVIKINYDPEIEEFCAHGNKDVLDLCRAFRNASNQNDAHVIVSYREIGRLAKMIDFAKMDVREAIETCLVKGLEKDTLNMLVNLIPNDVKYKKELKEIASY